MSAISGIGVISCWGEGIEPLWNATLEGRTALREGLGRLPESLTSLARDPLLLAETAARAALQQAGWDRLGPEDGLIVATTTGQLPRWEGALVDWVRGRISVEAASDAMFRQPLGALATALSQRLGDPHSVFTTASACSAGTQALALACSWIASGRVRRCLVGGVEVLGTLTIEGFRSLQLLSSEPCTPFDRDRKGIGLSEGAAFFCIERDPATPLAWINGHGLSTDAFHLASPHPEGRGCEAAMREALSSAGLQPSDIDWIHAHGTGSQANDSAESHAIATVFGSGADAPWTSSTKHVHGHALAASGAIETALCVEALRRQRVIPTAGLRTPDPALSVRHPSGVLPIPLRHILKNTLGFGGNNAALVPSATPRPATATTASPSRASRLAMLGSGRSSEHDLAELAREPSLRKATRPMLLATAAARAALSGIPKDFVGGDQFSLVLGTSRGELAMTRDFLTTFADQGLARPILFQSSLHNAPTGFLGLAFGITGPSVTVSDGAWTGERAIEAATLIMDRFAHSESPAFCLVVGVEATADSLMEPIQRAYPDGVHLEEGAFAILLGNPAAENRFPKAIRAALLDPHRSEPHARLPSRHHDSGILEAIHLAIRDGSSTEAAVTKYDGARSTFTLERILP